MMEALERALEILERGGVVAIPTETVYGLAGDATRREAVERIYAVKGRPLDHPVIVHLGSVDWLGRWAAHVPAAAERLLERFWPGPLTLILPRARGVGDWVTGGQDTVGLRMPAHPLTLDLLRRFGRGLAAPSANRFGRVSPTTAQHVRDDLGQDVELVLDGGPCQVGLESTIVDLSGDYPRILRPGRISVQEVEEAVGVPSSGDVAGRPRAPGTLASHYAPRLPTGLLRAEEDVEGQAVLTFGPAPLHGQPRLHVVLPLDPELAARELYAALRQLDGSGADSIRVSAAPAGAAWDSIRDRLSRAIRD